MKRKLSTLTKILTVLSVLFAILTIIGASYVIFSKGEKSPGFAVIPMLFSLIFSSFCTIISRKTN